MYCLHPPMMIGPDSAMIFALGWTTVLAPMVMSPKRKIQEKTDRDLNSDSESKPARDSGRKKTRTQQTPKMKKFYVLKSKMFSLKARSPSYRSKTNTPYTFLINIFFSCKKNCGYGTGCFQASWIRIPQSEVQIRILILLSSSKKSKKKLYSYSTVL